MPETYTRQSAFSNGDVVDAPLFNAEFDQLEEAFKADVGHNHDGTAGGGAPVPFIQKGTTGIYIDTSVPLEPKIVFKVNGAVVSETGGAYFATTAGIQHTPAETGVPIALKAYLDSLYLAAGNASGFAAEAAESADRAEAAAMTLGVPIILASGGTYSITESTVQADIVCLGNATINLPDVLTIGHRYSIRVSSTAPVGSLCIIQNPTKTIVGDILTLNPGDNLTLSPRDLVVLDVISTSTLEIL